MADGNILSDFGIDLLEEEIDDVIFQTNEFDRRDLYRLAKVHFGGYCRCAWRWPPCSLSSWRQAWRTK